MFAVRREILEGILSDPWWSKELEAAQTAEQAKEVIEDYCRRKGFTVTTVQL